MSDWHELLRDAYSAEITTGPDFKAEVEFYRLVRTVGIPAHTEKWAKPQYWQYVVNASVTAAHSIIRHSE